MKVTTSYSEFVRAAKPIRDPKRLQALGLEIDDILGFIWPHQVAAVLDFCEKNPRFHIVTYMGKGIHINRYDPRGGIFRLAEGDNDPNYMADRRHIHQWMFAMDPDTDRATGGVDLRKASK